MRRERATEVERRSGLSQDRYPYSMGRNMIRRLRIVVIVWSILEGVACDRARYRVTFESEGVEPVLVALQLSDESTSWVFLVSHENSTSISFVPERDSHLSLFACWLRTGCVGQRFGYFAPRVFQGDACVFVKLRRQHIKVRGCAE
jgi:hypothetical protein